MKNKAGILKFVRGVLGIWLAFFLIGVFENLVSGSFIGEYLRTMRYPTLSDGLNRVEILFEIVIYSGIVMLIFWASFYLGKFASIERKKKMNALSELYSSLIQSRKRGKEISSECAWVRLLVSFFFFYLMIGGLLFWKGALDGALELLIIVFSILCVAIFLSILKRDFFSKEVVRRINFPKLCLALMFGGWGSFFLGKEYWGIGLFVSVVFAVVMAVEVEAKY